MKIMFPQDVTYILTQKAFDTFPEFLNTIYVDLIDLPCTICEIRFPGFKFFDPLLHAIIH